MPCQPLLSAISIAMILRLLPISVGPTTWPDNGLPSLQLHYSAFIATTKPSAPVPRIGTLILTGAPRLDCSLRIGATGSHVPYKSLIQLHAAYVPDAARAAFRTAPELVPEARCTSGFDVISGISTRHQRFARARLSGPHLTESCPAFCCNAHHDRS